MIPPADKTGTLKAERRRDSQQWLLDWMVKTTGRTHNFAYDHREIPADVKTYRQIPRVMEKTARHQEAIARAAEAAGHNQSACEMYYRACETYRIAQHAIFYDDHPDKIYLHGKLIECFEGITRTADYPIERVEVDWNGVQIQANFHTVPDARNAPTILFIPGMDMTKEAAPDPSNNMFIRRGMNVLCVDGPGQGMSNLRKIRVTADNHEQATSACVTWLTKRPEVDPARIGVMGISMGSYWSNRLGALDSRVKAIGSVAANYGTKKAIFEEASPRFKQIFMYMAGIHDEDEFDAMAEQMHNFGLGPKLKCFSLMVLGEYDPLCHLEEGLAYFQEVAGPKELWVLENEFHVPRPSRCFAGGGADPFIADWLKDALMDRLPNELNRVRFIHDRAGGLGSYSPEVESIEDVYLSGRLKY
ncbi:MAG: alpha/beta hydrolase [Chloroflexi bacterium]|nr:alpha/beta hydrolase [Chloroflexota bacterium]